GSEFVLQGEIALTASTDPGGSGFLYTVTFNGVFLANIGSATLVRLNASGGLTIFTAGIAGTVQLTVAGDSRSGGTGFAFGGNFVLSVNTTESAQNVNNVVLPAGPYARLHINGFLQLTIANTPVFKLETVVFDLEF